MANYIRRELGSGQVKFIVITPGGTLVLPAAAALLFVFIASKLLPWSPAFVVVAAGGFLFYWLRNRIKQRKVERGSTFVASPTALVVREQTVPRASIEEVSWCDHSHQSTGTRVINGEYRPDLSTGDQLHRESSLSVETIGAGSIALAAGMDAGTAEQLAIDLGRALGGVKVSGGRFRLPN